MDTSFQPLGVGVGSLINGRYELIRKLGSGAMSAVYQVADHALNRDVIALKLFAPSINSDATLVERIHNEVIITRKLNASNIVRTYDFGQTKEGLYYMTMEYIEGVTLDKLVHRADRPAPSFRDIVRILRDAASAISYAHQHGIIHRDLKPANIIISLDGEVKIADFGLARALNLSHDLTRAGECVGTPYYMAPEQIQDQGVDGRTDVYALGIIGYELVTGSVPFQEKNWFQLAKMIIAQPLPEFDEYVRAPKWYADFVRKAAAKRPEERFQSAEELVGYLSERLERSDFEEIGGADAKLSRVLSHLGKSLARYGRPGVGNVISGTHLFIFGILMLGIFAAMLIMTPSGEIQKNIDQGSQTVNRMADTMNKLTNVVSFVVQNQDKIEALNKQMDPANQGKSEEKPKAVPAEENFTKPDIKPDVP